MKNLIFFLGVVLSGYISAAEVSVSDIEYIAPWPAHVDVLMGAEYVDDSNCGNSNTMYRIDLAEAGAEAKLSVLLAAFMAGKKVGLSLSGCVGTKPKISGIRLSK